MKKFNPDWVVAPGDTLEEWFNYIGMPYSVAWNIYDIPERTLKGVLRGTTHISPTLAQKLCNLTFVPAPFWLALEHNYRVGLAAGKLRGVYEDE